MVSHWGRLLGVAGVPQITLHGFNVWTGVALGPENLVFDAEQAGLDGWVTAWSDADGLLDHDGLKVADGNYVMGGFVFDRHGAQVLVRCWLAVLGGPCGPLGVVVFFVERGGVSYLPFVLDDVGFPV